MRARPGRLVVCVAAAITLHASPPSERALWEEIRAAHETPAEGPFTEAWFDAAAARGAHLLDRVKLYQLLYPGGAARDDVLAIELEARFEHATLTGGDFTALRARLTEIAAQSPPPAARAEAAWWQLMLPDATASSQPASRPADARRAALEKFVAAFPKSRHTPAAIDQLCSAIEREGADCRRLDRLVFQLAADFPRHPLTEIWQARQRLLCTGAPLEWTGTTTAGATITAAQHRGRNLILLVWTPESPLDERCLARLDHAVRTDPMLRAVGMRIGPAPADPPVPATARGADLPQVPIPAEWADATLRRLGVTVSPTAIRVGADGRVLAIARGPDCLTRLESWLTGPEAAPSSAPD